jgi:hypothetical protein
MNSRSDTVNTYSSHTSINPYEPLSVPHSATALDRLVQEIQNELEKLVKSIRNEATLRSSIFMVPRCDHDNQLFLAMTMYAARACDSPSIRLDNFDSLLLDLNAEQSPSALSEIKDNLILEHGDILERAEEFNRLMTFWFGALTLSSLITLGDVVAPNLPRQIRDIIDISIGPRDYATYSFLRYGVGMLGSAAGAWACISTMWKADDPESLAGKALKYVDSLCQQTID